MLRWSDILTQYQDLQGEVHGCRAEPQRLSQRQETESVEGEIDLRPQEDRPMNMRMTVNYESHDMNIVCINFRGSRGRERLERIALGYR